MATQRKQSPKPKASTSSRPASRRKATESARRSAAHDVAAIVITATGLMLLVAAISSSTGWLTEGIASLLRYSVGIGVYVLPVLLILWGVSFFVPTERVQESRVGIGMGLSLLSVIGMMSLYTPAQDFFRAEELTVRGGYIGSSVAWALFNLTGTTISAIILVTLGLVGLAIAGLSFSAIVERGTALVAEMREGRQRKASLPVDSAPRTVKLKGTRSKAADSFAQDSDSFQPSPSDAPTVKVGGKAAGQQKSAPAPVAPAVTASATPRAMEGFALPKFELLKISDPSSGAESDESMRQHKVTAQAITDTLGQFNVPATVVDWITGPTVTMFKVDIAPGTRLNKITGLHDNLALALAAETIRILAPIPGEKLVGIEVPNGMRSPVTLGDVLTTAGTGSPLLLGIGKDVFGESVNADLRTMPHLLIAGSTGSGKSVAINSMLTSMLMRTTPSEVRLILIDPKRVELGGYEGVPHLYVPVVTEAKEAASALVWAVGEMERRLKLFKRAKTRDIGAYSAMLQSDDAPDWAEELPYLVIVIDELADLMMIAAKEVESSIVRIAQLARAAGIHLIVATQRPEANIVTGLIKANITNRIAFRVASAIDSRVILDTSGAEKLTGYGDMLYSTPQWPNPKRIQGCYVSDSEIEAVVEHLKNQG